MNTIANMVFDEERALYGAREVLVKDCRFDGPADGESPLKECAGIAVEDCWFNLRYALWHDTNLKLSRSELTQSQKLHAEHYERAQPLRVCVDIEKCM